MRGLELGWKIPLTTEQTCLQMSVIFSLTYKNLPCSMKKKIKKQFHKVKVMHNKNNNFCMLQFQMNPMEDPFQGVVSVKKLVKFFFLIIANAILKFKSKQSKWKYISLFGSFCREWLQMQLPLKIHFIRMWQLEQNTDQTMRMWTIPKLWFYFFK